MSFAKNLVIGVAIAIGIILVISAGNNVIAGGSNSLTGNAVSEKINLNSYTGDYQEATLKMEGYEYIVEPSTLIKGVPVKMTVDLDTVYGCMRDIVISPFGVREYVKEGSNVIEFFPDKTGEIPIVCSMNMGRGSFTVVESDGSINSADQQEINKAASKSTVTTGSCDGSCGGSKSGNGELGSGSCGCGGSGPAGTCGA